MPMVHARDLRENIKELGFERGVVVTLELLLEEFTGYRQYLLRLADVQSTCIDSIQQLTEVGGTILQTVNDIRRSEEQYEQIKSEGIISDGDDRG